MTAFDSTPHALGRNNTLNAAAKANDLLAAWELLRKLPSHGLKDYNFVIDAAAWTGDLKAAEAWCERALVANVGRDASTHHIVVLAAAICGDLPMSERWLAHAQQNGIRLTEEVYECVILAVAERSNLEAAERRYSSFVQALPRCRGGCLNLPAPHFEALH